MPRPRKTDKRKVNRRMFILCEGEKTEPNYFKKLIKSCDFRGKPVTVEVVPCRKTDACGLILKAREYREAESDVLWVVVDKDFYTQHEKAYKQAEKNNVNIAFSSISFEFWILLHFQYTTRQFHDSEQIISHINQKKYFPKEYCKNDGKIFDCVKDKTAIAEKNAKKIRSHHQKDNPGQKPFELNPYTDVDILVKEIMEFEAGMKKK